LIEATNAIKSCAITTGRYQTERDPAKLFVDILRTALTQKRIHICDRERGRKPDNPQWWGYELNENEGTWHPPAKAEKLGWVDEEGGVLYLIPQATYRAIASYVSSTGDHFPADSVRAMGDALKRSGMLARTDNEHNAVTVRCEGLATKCWAIRTDHVIEEAPESLTP